jgi:pimeloyl-ACP methyl ester carboxylesterase
MGIGLETERLDTAVGKIDLVHGGAGSPVVYLHSAQGETNAESPLLQELASTFEVFAPVFPGFGESEGIEAIDDITDAMFHVVDVIERLDVAQPTLVGQSLGGWLAAEVAVFYPHLVSHLVLVNSLGLSLAEAPIPDLFRGRGDELAEMLFHDQSHPMAQMMHAMAEGIEDPVVLADIPFDVIRPTLLAMAATAKIGWDPYLHDPRLAKRLQRATMPALVVRSDDDRFVGPAHADAFVSLLPDARLVVIPDAGHLLALEQPAALAATIREFLAPA